MFLNFFSQLTYSTFTFPSYSGVKIENERKRSSYEVHYSLDSWCTGECLSRLMGVKPGILRRFTSCYSSSI